MTIKSIICDIDGVLMHDNTPVPGADKFLARIQEKDIPLVILTNYPSQTARIWRTASQPPGLMFLKACFTPQPWPPPIFSSVRKGKKPM